MNEPSEASMDQGQGGAVISSGGGEIEAPVIKTDQICRDYQRGVCSRGDKCKFAHPDGLGSEPKDKPMICRDFQNGTCNRSTCKYLHVTNQEEKVYLRTGQFPPSLGRGDERGGPRFDSGVAVCKDFLNNKCNRGSNCKFRHVQEDDVYGGFYSEPPRKRPRDGFGSDYRQLMEENVSLRGRVSDLQKEVADLRATNDILLEQNARYRRSSSNGATGYGGGYATDGRSSVTYPSRDTYAPTMSYNQSAYSVTAATPVTGQPTTGYDGYTKFE